MSIYTIVGITGVVLLIIGILTTVDWYKVFNKYWGNNPAKAHIYIEYGEQIDATNGKLYGVLEDVAIYQFTWNKVHHMVKVKHDYPWRFIKGRRVIRYFPGKVWAQPLPGYEYKNLGGSRELNVTIESQTAVDLVHSVKSRKALNIIAMILVIGAVCVGVWFFYNNFIKSEPVEPAPTEETLTPTPVPGHLTEIEK